MSKFSIVYLTLMIYFIYIAVAKLF